MLTKLYRLTCDECGSKTNPYPTVEQLRRCAKNVWRWQRRPKRGDTPAQDLCPKCARR